ncbi:hypothetical protein GCM10010914_30710 [Deinococcus wulumuqiensis]|uniref:Uncharacterized protein n=2 Tax=Deinococcus TaxID=1298 RepID=A0AAV4KD47_9DEIO|nr:hypothetical protein GCM10008021_30040 [Deinococcus wulumuqiensis]GGI93964.1 hypothetical protein GCM10010914_30710 [Deinococcus wulumuqiensis]
MTVSAQAGRVVAREQVGNRVLWSVPVPSNRTVHTAIRDHTVLIVTAQNRPWDATAATYDLRSGKRWWTQALGGLFTRLYVKNDTFFIEYISTGGESRTNTIIQREKASRPLAEVPGRMLTQNANALLFSYEGPVNPYEAVTLNYFRYNLEKHQLVPLNYRVPQRPNCGELQKDTTKVTDRVTNQYVYAMRSDLCGTFVARFDWTKPADTPPVIEQIP